MSILRKSIFLVVALSGWSCAALCEIDSPLPVPVFISGCSFNGVLPPNSTSYIQNTLSPTTTTQMESVQTSSITGSEYLGYLSGTQCLHEVNGQILGSGADCGSGSGNSFPLAVSSGSATNSVVVSSPTYNEIVDSNTFIASLQGSTSVFLRLNPSSVTLQGNNLSATYLTNSSATATYLQLSSATATYLQLSSAAATYLTQSSATTTYLQQSSATATYLQQSSATATYLQLSSATATYLNKLSYTSSGTVNQGTKGYVAYYNVTGTTVAPNASLQFGTNVSSFTTPVDLGSNRIHNVQDPSVVQDAMTLNYFNTHFPQTPNTAVYQDFSSFNIVGPGNTDTGYGVTITASSSTAPIMITVNGTTANFGVNLVYLKLFRDAVELCDTNNCAVSDNVGLDSSTSFSVIDIPGDTLPHLYEVFIAAFGSGVNATYNAAGIESSVLAQEIR